MGGCVFMFVSIYTHVHTYIRTYVRTYVHTSHFWPSTYILCLVHLLGHSHAAEKGPPQTTHCIRVSDQGSWRDSSEWSEHETTLDAHEHAHTYVRTYVHTDIHTVPLALTKHCITLHSILFIHTYLKLLQFNNHLRA